ncbi:hypothetical protein MW376_003028 [Citrobacter freundii]|nr:hypothetical protein [Citrobacter freundii]EJB8472908.1 hypothetical protein [Citrobacter freundii]EJB8558863.1 hypothetical protein [Citrobacter freundii]WFZ87084.1 hypothetical protein NFK79_11765 [Citrobacter freundii]WFZ87092.1 hypothetical protein NFK79_11805 [Citrobacter freundii]
MKKHTFIQLFVFPFFLFTTLHLGFVNAQIIKDTHYYKEHIEEAKTVVKECRTKEQKAEKEFHPIKPDNCQSAKTAVWLYNHTYKPKSD